MLFGWNRGTQVRHIVVTESGSRLFLTYYDPSAVDAKKPGLVPPKNDQLLELVRNGDGFGSAVGGAKLPLSSQANLCNTFLADNKGNAHLKKRVSRRGAPAWPSHASSFHATNF